MEAVLLVIHVLIAMALIGMVLIQRSDSDGFGMGSGGGSGFMSSRGTANFLTRTTAILATLFIISSLVLGIIASSRSSSSIVDTIANQNDKTSAIEESSAKKKTEQTDVKNNTESANKKQNTPTAPKSVSTPPKATPKKDAAPSVPNAE